MGACWRVLLMVLASLALALPAWAAGEFAGFSSDGQAYQVGKGQVCHPIFVDGAGRASASEAECETVKDKKTLQAYGFRKPKADGTLTSSAHGTSVHLLGRKKTLLVWDAGDTIDEVKAIYISPGRSLLALEVVVRADMQPDKAKLLVVAFDMGNRLGKKKPTQTKPQKLFARLTAKGRVWEQRIIPCQRAGVTLSLGKDGKFSLDLTLRCRADTDQLTIDGTWLTMGTSQVVLAMPQDEGEDEQMPCEVKACENDAAVECLACTSDAIGFTAQARDK